MKTINSFTGEYRFLSNFYPSKVVLAGDNLIYPTVENAYQAAKTLIPDERAVIQSALPGSAKRLGKHVTMRPDWDSVKLREMEELLKLKFCYPDLRVRLLGTKDAELIEGNTWGDVFWGQCKGIGQNHLGRLLMEIRSKL